jgi:hypothetical protein
MRILNVVFCMEKAGSEERKISVNAIIGIITLLTFGLTGMLLILVALF